jgi:hypothetical protein
LIECIVNHVIPGSSSATILNCLAPVTFWRTPKYFDSNY